MIVWERVQKAFKHAFALSSSSPPLTVAERATLEKIARALTARGLATPALLFLETLTPLGFLGSQVLHGLKPFLDLVCDPSELDRLATLLERRDGIELLITILQEGSKPAA